MKPDTQNHTLRRNALENLYESFYISHLDPDPLLIVREFSADEDREIAAFIASAFAYGGVQSIMSDVRDFFRRLNGPPREAILNFDPRHDATRFDGWYHRFHTSRDAAALCTILKHTLRTWGSLQRLFLSGFDKQHESVLPALETFVHRLRDVSPAPINPGPRFLHLLPMPSSGSVCKRLHLFLRWVVRQHEPDLNIWHDVPPSHLIIPVDTHVARICRLIGLTQRKNADGRMAQEITANLRTIDPDDPVRFDYALCRLGIMKKCTAVVTTESCRQCQVYSICAADGDSTPCPYNMNC